MHVLLFQFGSPNLIFKTIFIRNVYLFLLDVKISFLEVFHYFIKYSIPWFDEHDNFFKVDLNY